MLQSKIDKLQDAINEAHRFLDKANTAKARLIAEKSQQYGCYSTKEMASAKRASMDLTRSLSELRK